MFDEDDAPQNQPSDAPHPRILENLSIADLKDYIRFLEGEINRAHAEINQRQSARSGAESVFKS